MEQKDQVQSEHCIFDIISTGSKFFALSFRHHNQISSVDTIIVRIRRQSTAILTTGSLVPHKRVCINWQTHAKIRKMQELISSADYTLSGISICPCTIKQECYLTTGLGKPEASNAFRPAVHGGLPVRGLYLSLEEGEGERSSGVGRVALASQVECRGGAEVSSKEMHEMSNRLTTI